MKYLFYTTKRTKMKKIELNLIKNLSLTVMAFFILLSSAKGRADNLLSTIACNDTVAISMGIDCTTTVTPDQLLEGNYPDFGIFTVNIIDQNGVSIGDFLTSDYVNQTLTAEVYDTVSTNKCWSKITVVDKIAPPIECNEIYTTCYKDPVPGSLAPHNFRFAFNQTAKIPDNDTLKYSMDVGEIPGAHITDLNIKLSIKHLRILDLEAFLVSPNNDTLALFGNLTCGNANMEIELDDSATNSAADLSATCSPNDPTIEGKYKSIDNLSTVNNSSPTGTWVLNILDKNAGMAGALTHVDLLFKQRYGYINFPIPATSSNPIKLNGIDNAYRVVSGFDPCGEVILTYNDSLSEYGCTSNYTGIIYREWHAEDESGNISSCTQKIYIIRTGTAFLEFPHNYDNIDYDALSCNRPNAYTGEPGTELCNMVTVSHKDDTIRICSGSYKVIRHWKVSEMCSNEVIGHDQIIAVMDTEGPYLSNLYNFSVEADALQCSADVEVAFPAISDNCSDLDLLTYEIGYQYLDANGNPETPNLLTDNLKKVGDKYVLYGAKVGKIKFTYIVTDDCGNSSSRTNIVTIYDNSPPTAVCDQHTQIVIGKDGVAKAAAIVFDDGSNDNCSDVSFKVRRMVANCVPSETIFTDSITFCCEDVNTTQMVVLEVSDESGHKNTCMVEVNIIDKIPPAIKCPKDISIECTDDYLNLELTGDAKAFDNCGIDTFYHKDEVHINQCNVGWVKRTWYATDKNDYQAQPCYQVITIKDSDNFKFKGSDIIWPRKTVTFTDCIENFDTSITGSVRFRNEDFCSMVAARFKDDTFKVVDDACLKILRHWEVIDWCNFDNDPKGSTWNYTQVIMLQNEVAPVFDSVCQTRTFCTYGKCRGEVDYTKTATDDCTLDPNDLFWSYKIDIDNDGTWDIGPINSNHIKRIFDNGTYRVAWSVEDGCGNISTCEEIFIVKDCKKPTPLCITELTTVVMNYVGMVTICAKDFNLGTNCYNCNTGSYDNCTPKDELKYSFSKDTTNECITYTCDSIPNGKQIQKKLQMWVTDNAGNQDFCTVFINLEDNEGNACQDTTVGSIVYGFVQNPQNTVLPKVELKLKSNEQEKTAVTNNDGKYEFSNVSEDENYRLESNYGNNFLYGVTTLDIVLIQKHLLGIKKLDKPYQYIAADVNNSKTITASDILAIRKLILGSTEDFGKKTKSWTFVKESDDIRNNTHILSTKFDEINIDKTSFDKKNNLIGIKMGDINGSSDKALKNKINPRSAESISLISTDVDFNKNEIVYAEFNIDDIDRFTGAQFTLNFETENLKFEDIVLNNETISGNNFGLIYVDKGHITFSWVKPENYNNAYPELFKVKFTAKNSGKLSSNIKLSSDITATEAYDNNLKVMDMKLQFRDNGQDVKEYALYQNVPNPFSKETTVIFDLPSNQKATLSFYDVTGRKIDEISKVFNKGRNSVNISFDDKVSGIIYYTLETDGFTQTKKMITLK